MQFHSLTDWGRDCVLTVDQHVHVGCNECRANQCRTIYTALSAAGPRAQGSAAVTDVYIWVCVFRLAWFVFVLECVCVWAHNAHLNAPVKYWWLNVPRVKTHVCLSSWLHACYWFEVFVVCLCNGCQTHMGGGDRGQRSAGQRGTRLKTEGGKEQGWRGRSGERRRGR